MSCNPLCAACVHCIDEYSYICKAYPKGIPKDSFCLHIPDTHYGDPSIPLPDVKCANGYKFEYEKKHLEGVRYCFRMGIE